MNLAEARARVAADLTALTLASGTLRVRGEGPVPSPKTGDGWVIVRRIAPAKRFGPGCVATVEALVVAGADEAAGEAFVSAHGVAVLRAVADDVELGASDLTVEPQALVVGASAAPLYCLVLTATIETE